ncbi:MAG: NTP transferase domain-containing protein, partial [Planctomycetota bacterium]
MTSPYAGLVGDAPAAGDSTFASPDAFGTTDGSPSACACVLAAGQGTRMKSDKAKVLHEVLGAPLLAHVLDACAAAGVARAIAVVGHQRETVEGAFAGREGLSFALQADQRGTGHAVLCAREAWVAAGKPATLLVLCGDAPLQRPSTLRALLQEQEQAGNAATLLTAKVEDPTGYGRIVRAPEGGVAAIVEQRDASEAQRAIREINSGTYVFDAVLLFQALEALCGRELAARADGKKAEHYLTDVVAAFVSAGRPVGAVIAGDAVEILGINDRRQLLNAQRLLHERRMIDLLEAGVVIPQPDKVVIEHGATVGAGTVIHPFTVIRRGVVVGEDCEVGPFAHLG